MIIFNQVEKYKNGARILNKISFQINQNEFVIFYSNDDNVLSALRKLLSTESNPDNGLIKVSNKYDHKKDFFDNKIGIVYQQNILLNDRKLTENCKFILNVKNIARDYFQKRIDRVLELVDLEFAKNLTPKELLPHQLVRANIAQALLNYPSLLIIEKPTLNLDEVNSKGIIHLLETINNYGITVVLLSNNKKLVNGNNTGRVIFLEKGEVLAEKV